MQVEVSLQPWRAFKPDGVILFSDILTPLTGMNIPFDIEAGRGPIIHNPIRTMQVPCAKQHQCNANRSTNNIIGEHDGEDGTYDNINDEDSYSNSKVACLARRLQIHAMQVRSLQASFF